MVSEHRIGPHRYVIDGDLVHNMADPHTALDLEMMQAYTKLLELVLQKYGRVFLLSDGRALFNISPEARRHLASWPSAPQIIASAIYGANAVSRALVKLIAAAMEIVQSSKGKQPAHTMMFFASEAEARAWLDKERCRYLAAHPEAPQ